MSFASEVKRGHGLQQSSSSRYQRCPYNPKHKVENRNFPTHIQKCRSTHNANFLSRFATCKYNSLHIFSIYQIGAHEMTCPNRNAMINLEEDLLDDTGIMHEELSQSQVSNQPNQNSLVATDKIQPKPGEFSLEQVTCPEVQLKIENQNILKIHSRKQQQNKCSSLVKIERGNSKTINSRNQISSGVQFSRNHKKDNSLAVKEESSVEQEDLEVNKVHLNHNREILNSKHSLKDSLKEHDPKLKSNSTGLQTSKKSNESTFIKDIDLQKCSECSRLIYDVNIKLWKNKKLVKYLKAYSKLEQEHEQIREYLKNIPKFLTISKSITDEKPKTESRSPSQKVKVKEQASMKVRIEEIPIMDSKTMMIKSEAVLYADEINKSSISNVSSASNNLFTQHQQLPEGNIQNFDILLDLQSKRNGHEKQIDTQKTNEINRERTGKKYEKKINSQAKITSLILLDENSMVVYDDKDLHVTEEKTVEQRPLAKQYGAKQININFHGHIDESLIL